MEKLINARFSNLIVVSEDEIKKEKRNTKRILGCYSIISLKLSF